MDWILFKYKSGANPYIVTTEKEYKRMLKKYKGKIEEINNNIYEIDDLDDLDIIDDAPLF